jgi:acyl-CoA thioesterase-2
LGSQEHYADDVAGVLEIEQLDRHLFRGANASSARGRTALYGGQVAAQALKAAGLSVTPGRQPHSFHGYFLRPGRVDQPVILRVDPDRDGRSFSARHVAAIQDGCVIFSMLASFHEGTHESVLDRTPEDGIPGPEECSTTRSDTLTEIDIREVTRREVVDGHMRYPDCMWLRTVGKLPGDPLSQACGLTYLSDMGSGFGQMTWERPNGGPSLDHAVWFHEPVRADDWVLLHMWPRKAMGIRGLYDGAMRAPDGRLAAALAQEHLLIHLMPPRSTGAAR